MASERLQQPSAPRRHNTRQALERRVDDDPPAPGALRLAWLDPLRVVVVRALPAAACGWIDLLREGGVMRLPAPGHCEGDAVRIAWRSPTEYWIVTRQPALLDRVVEALRPGATALACAVDRSAGTVGIALQGDDIDQWLSRLVDAAALPARAGQATRARCADLPVVLLRVQAQRVWLLVERPVADFLVGWLLAARDRMTA